MRCTNSFDNMWASVSKSKNILKILEWDFLILYYQSILRVKQLYQQTFERKIPSISICPIILLFYLCKPIIFHAVGFSVRTYFFYVRTDRAVVK